MRNFGKWNIILPIWLMYFAVLFMLSPLLLTVHSGSIQSSTTNQGSPTSSVKTGIKIGEHAPDFTLPSMAGSDVSLSSFLGKKVLLNFWASWCGPCQVEAPHIKAVYDQHSKDELIVLTVDLAFNDDPASVKKFIDKFKLAAPVLLDLEGKVAQTYGTNFIPMTYFIDTQGVIQSVKFGPFYSLEDIEESIDKLQ